MNFDNPVIKQETCERLRKEKQMQYRKLHIRYSKLFAYLEAKPGPDDVMQKLYLWMRDLAEPPKCGNLSCTEPASFVGFEYREFCGRVCSGKGCPRGFTTAAHKQVGLDRMAARKADIGARLAAGSEVCRCGQTARFYNPQTRLWRCEEVALHCRVAAANMGEGVRRVMKGKSRIESVMPVVPLDSVLCHYGCGSLAQFKLSRACGSKLCCSPAQQGCSKQKSLRSQLMAEKLRSPEYVKTLGKRNRSSFARKEVTLASGKKVLMRGWEQKGYEDLLSIFDEADICCDLDGSDDMPIFAYWLDGVEHHYMPDFYIRSINTIVEVKSLWFYSQIDELTHRKNVAKQAAVVAEGYEFVWFIYKGRNKQMVMYDEIAELDKRLKLAA